MICRMRSTNERLSSKQEGPFKMSGWRDGPAGRVLSLYVADLGLHPSTTCVPLSIAWSDP